MGSARKTDGGTILDVARAEQYLITLIREIGENLIFAGAGAGLFCLAEQGLSPKNLE
jgi:hypothetical protein